MRRSKPTHKAYKLHKQTIKVLSTDRLRSIAAATEVNAQGVNYTLPAPSKDDCY